MWWSRRGLILSALAAGGCGFTPLYGEDSPAAALAGRIAIGRIARGPLPDRMGFALRESLIRRLGVARDPGFRLDLTLKVEETGLAITPDNATTRYSLTATADWDLVQSGTASPVLSGSARSFSAHSATATVYATRIAARDAERRLAEDLAQRIVTQIAASAAALTP